MIRSVEAAERLLGDLSLSSRPKRIVCLTEETVDVLYRLGAEDQVVGVSVYAKHPPEARRKPRVSAFAKADYTQIEALQPDLVLCFSDVQAEIAAECVRRGLQVVVFNQRSLGEILGMILALGALVGREREARDLEAELRDHLLSVGRRTATVPRRPRVYFEEWHDPLITGIRWVAELITLAGGDDVFADLSTGKAARERVVDPDDVIRRDPELILASWCGKRVQVDSIVARPGWEAIAAVRDRAVHEIESSLILQPGPVALTEGLSLLCEYVERAASRQ